MPDKIDITNEKLDKAHKKYEDSEKGKAAKKRYFKSGKGKAAQKRYQDSEKGKAAQLRYQKSPKAKKARQKRQDINKIMAEQIKNYEKYLETHPDATIDDYLEELRNNGGLVTPSQERK